MKPSRRRAFTALEVLLVVALLSVVVTIVVQFQGGAGRMSKKTGEVSEAMRSVLLATEFLRIDLGRTMVLDDATEVTVENEGRKLNLSISDKPDADLSKLPTVRISYYVEPLPGNPGVFRLLRQAPGVTHDVKDCYLTEFRASYVPLGEISFFQAYVEVTMVGVGAPRSGAAATPAPAAGSEVAPGADSFVASMLLPLGIPKNPYPYEMLGGLNVR